MTNWKTATNAMELGQALNISNEALYQLAMLNLRLNFDSISNDAKDRADRRGEVYRPSIIYWDVIEASIKQLYNVV